MADNKRFVSYMYEYKNDEKHNNVGYARVESRTGQSKVFIHININGMEGSLLKAYMFYRKPTKNQFAYLGNILIHQGSGELKVKSDRNNFMNSELSLDDMQGVIIYRDNRLFYACEWDGQSISHSLIDDIESYGVERKNIEFIATDELEAVEDKVNDPILVVDHSKEVIEEDNDVPIEVVQVAEVALVPSIEDEIEEDKEYVEFEEDIAQQELYKNQDYYDDHVISVDFHKYRNMQLELKNSWTATTQTNDYEEIECVEPTYSTVGVEPKTEQQPEIDISKYECHPVAKNIFRRCPRIYPFEDNEITDCVRIEPQDIGLLPIDAWVLGNNSFLLHGYYTYRHLIFGRIIGSNESTYVLGVPGIYQNKESFMARMFGFEKFKSAARTEQKDGEFGYFYVPIQLN